MANGQTFQPGAAQFGNFINYYEFNAPESRLELFPEALTSLLELDSTDGIVCLDIGCNSGDMTLALQERLSRDGRTVRFLAVDLDAVLIERGREKLQGVGGPKFVTFERLDVMDDELTTHTFGTYLTGAGGKNRFDLGFCLSITMWIHLNHGDEGLRRFLHTVSKWVDRLVVEPQPLKCYKNAVRRMRRLGHPNFPHDPTTLAIQGADVAQHVNGILVEECDMIPVLSFGQTRNWRRPLVLYKRNVLKRADFECN